MRVIVRQQAGDSAAVDASPCAEAVQVDVPGVGVVWTVNVRSMEDLLRFVEQRGACTIRSSRVDDFELEIDIR